MSFIGGMSGGGGGGNVRFGQTRGRMQGSMGGVNYPSPFFDVAHTYLPTTVKQLFRWCRYYFLTNPLINATVFKLSEYPITDLVIDHPNPAVQKMWTEYFQEHLNYRGFQIECGLDYHAYGNAAVSLGFPFKKSLTCQVCKFTERAEKIRNFWVYTNNEFRMTCPKCGLVATAVSKDIYMKNASGIKTIRWNPEDIEVKYNDITGEYTYFYTIPATVRNDIVIGKKDVVEGVPQVFLEAVKQNKGVIFSKDNFFHLRRATLANQDRGWGIPLLLPVLKDTYYLQIMKKAQEAILLEHIVPLRVLFPQAGSGTADPYTSINLVDWRDHVAAEIARWRYDQNYIPIMPLPLGNQTIGGDGRALMLTQEIQAWSEQIMVGMGVPREFLMGGMSYAGTNVSMRMLENAFIGYILRHKALVNFVMRSVAAFMDWPEVKIRFKPFKMADDIQRKAYLFQLNQAAKVSDTTLLSDADLDQKQENELMEEESTMRVDVQKKQQLALAEIQGEAQLIMMKFQAKAQQTMATAMGTGAAPGEAGGANGAVASGPPDPTQQLPAGASPSSLMQSQLNQSQRVPMNAQGQATGMNIDLPSAAMAQANLLKTVSPAEQKMMLSNLRSYSPELADMVEQQLAQMTGGGAGGQPADAGVDMTPLPEQRGPRRAAGMV